MMEATGKAVYLYDTREIQLRFSYGNEVHTVRMSVDNATEFVDSIRNAIDIHNDFIEYLKIRGVTLCTIKKGE